MKYAVIFSADSMCKVYVRMTSKEAVRFKEILDDANELKTANWCGACTIDLDDCIE